MEPVTKTTFNYIITIHNKEKLIEEVILGVLNNSDVSSVIYPVLDGCTDRTESIIDDLIARHPQRKIVKLFCDDVHELKSINKGLEQSGQEGHGFNIILQDDVVLVDAQLENHCVSLYDKFPNLGMISFRHGGNLSRPLLSKKSHVDPLVDYIENECGHSNNEDSMLNTGYFTFREVVIKSPICIPFRIVRSVGVPDERYAPWDDTAYCYSINLAGFRNGVLAVDYKSDVAWGTTREKVQKVNIDSVIKRNLSLFKSLNKSILKIDSAVYDGQEYQIFDARKPLKNKGMLSGLKKSLRRVIKQGKLYYKILTRS